MLPRLALDPPPRYDEETHPRRTQQGMSDPFSKAVNGSPPVESDRDAAIERERFLAGAGQALAQSLDYQQTLRTVARLAVPAIADWCVIDLLREDGTLERVATEHREPARAALALALHNHPPNLSACTGAPHVVRTRRTEYESQVTDARLEERESDPERLRILRELRLCSTICAPLISRDCLVGAITVSTEHGRHLNTDDVRIVEELAQRAATAIDNARLYLSAQNAIRARERILEIVTHDLRTPLSSVAMNATVLSTLDAALGDPERIRKRAEAILTATQQMSRLLTDLTDLAQIDRGRLTLECALEDPADIVRTAIDLLQPVAANRGSVLSSHLASSLPQINCDRQRILQVLANLVSNAAKVGAHDIVLDANPGANEVIFSVRDNGPGIPQDDLTHMFERYWRALNTPYAGTGLGLPISNGIVRAHGGRIWVESAVGTGSTFAFAIPVATGGGPASEGHTA